jgi:hypothetical protein
VLIWAVYEDYYHIMTVPALRGFCEVNGYVLPQAVWDRRQVKEARLPISRYMQASVYIAVIAISIDILSLV